MLTTQAQQTIPQDYLTDWPNRYHEIEDPNDRYACLKEAIRQSLDPERDKVRLALFERRYNINAKHGMPDLFMNAWMMINAASSGKISVFNRKFRQRELTQYMTTLCLLDFPCETDDEKSLLREEWHAFAALWIHVCAESRDYCSTFFGIVPIKDDSVARKIAREIVRVTQTYPAALGYGDEMKPFSEVMVDTYCDLIENGDAFIKEAQQQ
jgi:hypothetical protein